MTASCTWQSGHRLHGLPDMTSSACALPESNMLLPGARPKAPSENAEIIVGVIEQGKGGQLLLCHKERKAYQDREQEFKPRKSPHRKQHAKPKAVGIPAAPPRQLKLS